MDGRIRDVRRHVPADCPQQTSGIIADPEP
jgi:hypothetical protein